MKAEKILFVAQEITPYVPENEISSIEREIAVKAIEEEREVRAFMPKWGHINERRNQLHEVIRLSGLNISIDDVDHQLVLKVATLAGTKMQVYFIDNEDFYGKRLEEMDAKGKEYKDNLERCVFYARGVIETIKKLRWIPDVIHCQGWISALVPLYLKQVYKDDFAKCKIVYTSTPNNLTKNSSKRTSNILYLKNGNAVCDGIKCMKDFGTVLTPIQLEMMAVKYADGTILPEGSEELGKYAKKQKKTVLYINDASNPQLHLEFFDQILSEASKAKGGK